MSIISKLFGRNKTDEQKTGGIEDYMTLVNVYLQATIASTLGINNLAQFPQLRLFKQTLHVPTQNNKLGVGEKNQCKKMLKEIYNIEDNFFAEIDKSIRKNCKKITDVQSFQIQFQAFNQDLMMLLGNLMKFKMRMPSFFKGALRKMTANTVHDIFTKNDFTDAGVLKTVAAIRTYNQRLGFSEQWVSDFVFNVVMLAKQEKRAPEEDK